MGLLKRLREAVHVFTSPPLEFRWSSWPDPELPDKMIHECSLPGGGYFLAQEVSAPDESAGHWGWQLMNDDGDVVEMRNGFWTAEETKAHAEGHYRVAYAGSGEAV